MNIRNERIYECIKHATFMVHFYGKNVCSEDIELKN